MSKKKYRPQKSPGNVHTRLVDKGVSFPCPFCTGEVSAGGEAVVINDPQFDNPRFGPPMGTMGAFHSMPPCEKFLALEPADFLRAARLAMVAKRKELELKKAAADAEVAKLEAEMADLKED